MVDAAGLLDINLFSLDVEGGELSVLRTLDLEATNVQVVLVELDGSNVEKDRQARPSRFGPRPPCRRLGSPRCRPKQRCGFHASSEPIAGD